MALYNQLVFGLLCVEIITFLILIVPLPFTWRRALFKTIATSPILAKVQYALKIIFCFVALLFVDAVNQMRKVQREGALARETGARPNLRGENDYRSRKFLSERNFYIYAFTLFLSLILSRTYSLVLDLIKAQEDLAILQTKVGGSGGAAASKEKAQLVELQKEYDSLAEKYAKVSGEKADKKKD
ncbi:B-cell receptor-associated 31-like protein [Meredithblackwellia eburnea MCA 4105]